MKFKEGVFISESIKTLIKHMMAYSEQERISWEELFNHSYIQEVVHQYKNELNVIDDSVENSQLDQQIEINNNIFDDFDFDPVND